ncbi:MAG: hypothetical protein ACM3MB_10240 [Acidobacteriota bacterium]
MPASATKLVAVKRHRLESTAPDRVIIRMVMEHSLLLTIGAFLFGLILIQNTYQLFPRTILLVPGDILFTFVIAFAVGILASILGLWHALKTQPAMALWVDNGNPPN